MGVACLGSLAWLVRHKTPAIPAALAYVTVALLPVSGVAQVGPQLTADRYSYLPGMAWATLVAGIAVLILRPGPVWRGSLALPMVGRLTVLATLVALAWASSVQTMAWRDGGTFWRRTVEVNPQCWRCQLSLGEWYRAKGEARKARVAYERAWELNPDLRVVDGLIAVTLAMEGRLHDAIVRFRRIVSENALSPALKVDFGITLLAAGRAEELVDLMEGSAGGSAAETLAYFEALTQTEPDNAVASLGRVVGLAASGRAVEACAELARLGRLSSDLAARAAGRLPCPGGPKTRLGAEALVA
jgi:tetratricopeptide (TPR) repeat protein